MLRKLYDKSKLWFAVAWIIVYCAAMSAGDALSAGLGVEKSVTLAVGLLLCIVLFGFLKRHGLLPVYGFCRPQASCREALYYIPLLFLLSANLWLGVTLHYGALETALYILSMLCVGFLEEVIFRGLLLKAMWEDSPKWAIIISSITFGIGHIINLVNGSGAELIPNLLQVVYATAAGFLFVMLYIRTKSLLPCIVTHGVFNTLSVFAVEPPSLTVRLITCLLLTVLSGGYAAYLAYTMKRPGSK